MSTTEVEHCSFDTVHVHGPRATVRVRSCNYSATVWAFTTITPGFERNFITYQVDKKRAIEIGRDKAARALTHAEAKERNQCQLDYIQHQIDQEEETR